MKEFFQDMPYVAWSVVSVMLALTVIAAKWEQVKWWWHNTWYSFPVVGKIATLSRNTRKDDTQPTWFSSEKKLCQDYKTFLSIQSEHDFNERIKYLTIAGDDGRSPMPVFIWILTVGLVIVEALGFSYVLAGYTLPGASENMQELGALGIAFLISVILVVLTHAAGRQLYISLKIKTARRLWNEGNDGRTRRTFGTQPVSLNEPQSIDANEPHYVRLANRVGTEHANMMGIVAIIFVLIVAIGATYVRGQVLEKQLAQEITSPLTSQGFSLKIGQDGLNFSSDTGKQIVLPLDSQEAAKKIDKANNEYQKSIDRQGGWGTFIVLAFVFIFLQIISVYFGYNWGFAGRQSAEAYRGTKGFARYDDVYQKYEEISDVAQSKLVDLQEKIAYRNSTTGTAWVRSNLTFKEFLKVSREESNRARVEIEQESDMLQTREQQRHIARQNDPVSNSMATKNSSPSLERLIEKIDALKSNEEKKDFISSLEEPMMSEIIKFYKNRKEEEASKNKRQRNEDLDNLF